MLWGAQHFIGETLQAFPLREGQGNDSIISAAINRFSQCSYIKAFNCGVIRIGKEAISFFAEDMVVYLEHPRESMIKLKQ